MACCRVVVRIEESADFWVIVAALEVVQAGFLIVDVAAVAEGVILAQGVCKGAGGGQEIAPGVVGVLDYDCAGFVGDGDYVALEVRQVEVVGAVPNHCQGGTFGIVGKGQLFGADGQLFQFTAHIGIAVGGSAVCPFGTQTVCVVGVVPCDGAVKNRQNMGQERGSRRRPLRPLVPHVPLSHMVVSVQIYQYNLPQGSFSFCITSSCRNDKEYSFPRLSRMYFFP